MAAAKGVCCLVLGILGLSSLSYGTTVFSVTHTPKEVAFDMVMSKLDLSELEKVYAHLFVMDDGSRMSWDGLLAPASPFYKPSAAVLFKAPGLPAEFELNNVLEVPVVQDIPFSDSSASLQNLETVMRAVYEDRSLFVRMDERHTAEDLQDSSSIMENLKISGKPLLSRLERLHELEGSPLRNVTLLKVTNTVDRLFLAELDIIWQAIKKVQHYIHHNPKTMAGASDLIVFSFERLADIATAYPPPSAQCQEAVGLIRELITQATTILSRVYDKNVFVGALSSDLVDTIPSEELLQDHRLDAAGAAGGKVLSRHRRQATGSDVNGTVSAAPEDSTTSAPESVTTESTSTSAPTSPPTVDEELRQDYNASDFGVVTGSEEHFTAIFNIFLWLMVFLFLTVLFVSYGMWHMDPGRDSIIYRMTNQKLKKDL